MRRVAGVALLLTLAVATMGASCGHAIGAYFQPVSTMTTDRMAALKLERTLALEYVQAKVLVTQACKSQSAPKPLCANLMQLAKDFEHADALVLLQLYDLSTSAFDLGRLMEVVKVLGATATMLAPLAGL